MSRKIEALQEAAALKAQEASDRVDKALERMVKQGQKINFTTVAHSANVSTAYLYKHDEIRNRIETLRDQQKNQAKPKRPPQASDNSKTVIIQTLRNDNKRLQEEIRELRKQNEVLTGRLYQQQGSDNLADRLRKENQKLSKENSQLKLKIESLNQELESLQNQYLETHPKVTSIAKRKTHQISEVIKDELETLNIPLNTTLTKTIKGASEDTVLAAIEAVKHQLETREVDNPGGLLNKAIQEGWTKSESSYPSTSSPQHLDKPNIYHSTDDEEKKTISSKDLAKLSNLFKDK